MPPCGQKTPPSCRWTHSSPISRSVLCQRTTAFPFISALFIIFSIHRNNKDLKQVLCEFYFLTSLFWEVLERHFLRIHLVSLFLFCKCGDHKSCYVCFMTSCMSQSVLRICPHSDWGRRVNLTSEASFHLAQPLRSAPFAPSDSCRNGVLWKDRGQEP